VAHNIILSQEARQVLDDLKANPALKVQCKAVVSTFRKMAADLRYPGLNTHEMKGEDCPHGKKLYTAYAQNHTPGAWRVFWCYCGPGQGDIIIVTMSPHL
jgi:hypothetical protein